MRKFTLCLLIFGFIYSNVYCQNINTVKVKFDVSYHDEALQLNNEKYYIKDGGSIKFEAVKFYISSVQLLKNNLVQYKEQNSYHLIDLADTDSQTFDLYLPTTCDYNTIKFKLGIDSLTNVSGAFGGDLDPTNAMYWTWQSGYINAKIEGRYSNKNNEIISFKYHLGGYQYPFNAMQQIVLTMLPAAGIHVSLDLSAIMEQIDLNKTHTIMSPQKEAVAFSSNLANSFKIK